jgi:hypothetical protein
LPSSDTASINSTSISTSQSDTTVFNSTQPLISENATNASSATIVQHVSLIQEIIDDVLDITIKWYQRRIDFTEEEGKRYKDICSRAFDPNVISKNYGIIIGSKDVDGLKYASWLNDNVINFYYNILQQEWDQQHNASTSFTSVRLYNTQFVATLYTANKTYNYDSRWSKALAIDMSSLDLLIIPINVDNYHWVCAALWLKTKKIEYYDS